MAKRNIMEALNVTPDGEHFKKPYDLSNFVTFHQKGGMINVVGVRDTVPNSNYRMSVDGFTKTLLCNTANFAHIKENYYFVHVPLGLISRNAYQMLVQRSQQYSALDMRIEQFPVFNLAAVVNRCLAIASNSSPGQSWLDVHGFNIGAGALRLLDMLGYGYYGDILDAILAEKITLASGQAIVSQAIGGDNGLKPNVARIAAYQCVWYNFFRNDIYDNAVTAACYNFDDVTYNAGDGSSANYDVTSVRGVDSFIKTCLQMRYVPYKKDIFMSSMPGTQFGSVSTVSLMDNVLLDINIPSSYTSLNQDNAETKVIAGDNAYGISVLPPDSDSGEFGRIVTSYAPEQAVSNRQIVTNHTHTVAGGVTSSTLSSGTSLFDVLSLVESQAIQKWRQKSMLAGNKTADQFRAHHGVVPKHLIDHLPDFIGSVDNEIVVKEITSSANTLDADNGENNLGEIRGRGYGASDSRTFNFYSDDYGVLLLLHAIVPENTYSSFGLEKGNMMVYYNDYFQSEYENIGLETVPKVLLNTLARYPFPELAHGTGQNAGFADDYDEGNIGYAPRNYGYKQYPSVVHGMFNPNRLIDTLDPNQADIFGYSDMQSFVLTRRDLVGRVGGSVSPQGLITSLTLPLLTMSLSKLYVNPSVFDTIFAFDADNRQDTDAFITHCKFNCEAMLPMSLLGLPQF